MKLRQISAVLAACTLTIATGNAIAQDNFPTKPLRLVVPLATGGEVIATSPAQAHTFLVEEIDGYKNLVERAKIKVE